MRKIFILLLYVSLNVSAQDVIVKKDGSTIISKVLEVNQKDIKYKKHSNKNGPTYIIDKSEIMSINYENGDKDSFNANEEYNKGVFSLVKKSGDARNKKIISYYNKYYKPTEKIIKEKGIAKHFFMIFGVKSSSTMSNEDIEIKIVRNVVSYPKGLLVESGPFNSFGGENYIIYTINLTNKTDQIIYIDKGNCFKLNNKKETFCYYNPTEQTTISKGTGSNASIGLGSVASVLGIGGAAGQLANGVSVGGGNTQSAHITYMEQRFIAIPPHGNCNLTEEKWVELSKGKFKRLGKAENFNFDDKKWDVVESSELGIQKGLINSGQVIEYNETNSPWTREYIITYSTDNLFRKYSMLQAEVYLREVIGSKDNGRNRWGEEIHERVIEGINDFTIEGHYK